MDAEAIWFDSRNDLAILRVPGPVGAPALRARTWTPRRARRRRSSASPRTAATTCEPARLGQHRDGDHPGRLRPRPGAARDHLAARAGPLGNSGGPMVDGRGRVVTTIFAATVSDGGPQRASACRTRSCATRSRSAAARWTPGPAPKERCDRARRGPRSARRSAPRPGAQGGQVLGLASSRSSLARASST